MKTHRRDAKTQRAAKRVMLAVALILFTPSSHATETLTVAVASSLYPTMQQQAQAFEETHDVAIRLVAGSTGRLYNQIMQGAPFDLFIAADARRPAMLAQHGKAIARANVGHGYLGIVIGSQTVDDPIQLTAAAVRRIVIANPDVAPFGLAAKTFLQKQGLWQQIKPKLVYAQNAMQARMMVDKGLVDAGLVPVAANQPHIATIPYVGVLLTHRNIARTWLTAITQP